MGNFMDTMREDWGYPWLESDPEYEAEVKQYRESGPIERPKAGIATAAPGYTPEKKEIFEIPNPNVGISTEGIRDDLPFGSEERRIAEGREVRKFTNVDKPKGKGWEDIREREDYVPRKPEAKTTTETDRITHVEALKQNALRDPRAEAQKRAMEDMKGFMKSIAGGRTWSSLRPEEQAHVLREYHGWVGRLEQEQVADIQREAKSLGVQSAELKRKAGVAEKTRETQMEEKEFGLEKEKLRREYISDLNEYLEDRYPRDETTGVRMEQEAYTRDMMIGTERINARFGGSFGQDVSSRIRSFPETQRNQAKERAIGEIPFPSGGNPEVERRWKIAVSQRMLEILQEGNKAGGAGIKVSSGSQGDGSF